MMHYGQAMNISLGDLKGLEAPSVAIFYFDSTVSETAFERSVGDLQL